MNKIYSSVTLVSKCENEKKVTKLTPGPHEEINAGHSITTRSPKTPSFSDKSEYKIFLSASIFRSSSDFSKNAHLYTSF